jgi:1,4-alpha-glucan branching enzyme
MNAMNGYLGLVLTAHVPYLRHAGRDAQGEDALHETIAQAIVPTLNALFDLRELGHRPSLALAYSPILLEQLADNVVQKHFVVWMEQWIARVEASLARWEAEGREHHVYLARFYLDWGQGVLRSFEERYGRNLVNALRELCLDGILEPLAGPATHAYMPLLNSTESINAQIDVGLLASTRHLGLRPRGFWLPECGYSPQLDQALLSSGLRYTIVDPSSLPNVPGITHLRPRWVYPRRFTICARDEQAMKLIWSPELGYLGDLLYRAPQRDPDSGLALWQTGKEGEEPALYDPYHAFVRTHEHADHWRDYVVAQLEAFRAQHDRPGLVLVPLEAELLGRRWFEGPNWLRAILESFITHPTVALTSPAAYLRSFRPRQGATPHDGSWGVGDHSAWGGRTLQLLRQAISESEEWLAQLVKRYPHATGDRERILAQALRELLLAQSSDWQLLQTQTGQDEALERPTLHIRRCMQLCAMAEQPSLNEEEQFTLAKIEEEDNPFPFINYRLFARR